MYSVHSYAFTFQSEKRTFLAKLFKVKISKTAAQEERESKQDMDEESPCSAAVVDPVQSATPSTPAPDYKPSMYHILSSQTQGDAQSLSVSTITFLNQIWLS